jgi:MYXO-CTERM domain-containing protein
VATGTYVVESSIACTADGTDTQPIVVHSDTPLMAHLQFNALEGFHVQGKHWHFEGLDIKGICARDSDCEHAFHVTGGADGFVMRSNRIFDFNAQLKVNADQVQGTWTTPNDGLVEGNELGDAHARNTTTPVTKLNIDTGDRWIVRANYVHDFHIAPDDAGNAQPTYGAFMKAGGHDGVFERNLVICTHDYITKGAVNVGLSFGGGGTAPQYCAPAFDANVPCNVEHTGGMMRNNIIVNCSDVGIYVNRGASTRVFYNTIIATTGVDFRFDTTTGDARGNVLAYALRTRDNATLTKSDDLENVSANDFHIMYRAPFDGDLRIIGDISSLLGKGAALPDVTDDYCLRTRSGAYDLGALQSSLGDCITVPPPLVPETPDAGSDASGGGIDASTPDAGSGSDAGNGETPGNGSTSSGCGCGVAGGAPPWGALVALASAAIIAARRRSRRA